MIRFIKENSYDRSVLIGRPNLTLKNFQCQNITCNKTDKFKKYKEGIYICECGYITKGDHEIETTHKIKFFCKTKSCPERKTKMTKECLKCQYIGER
jgi:hypothetical protein